MVEHVLIFAIKYRVYFLGDQNLHVQGSRRPHLSNTGWRGDLPLKYRVGRDHVPKQKSENNEFLASKKSENNEFRRQEI